jgi:hypothetical protein
MPFCLGCAALFMPRVVFALVWMFSNWLEQAIVSGWWLLAGFLFFPLSALTYSWIVHATGQVEGLWYVVMGLAVLADLGLLGSGARRRKED